MRTVYRLVLSAVIGVSSWGAGEPLFAQSWPQRTVRVIVPLPPGTAVDLSARLFGEHLSERWHQPVVIENITGADGILAAKEFISRHDDHTLIHSFAGLITINPILYEKLPYNPTRDLAPISISSDNFLVIAASAKLGVGSLSELVNVASSRSAKFSWAATAGLPYFAYAGFLKKLGIEMVYVPYRDFNPALSDLDEGRIEVASTALTQLLPHSQAGKASLLAVLNRTRSPLARSVPTATEAGYPELAFDGVTGFFGWRDMPTAIRDRISAEVRAIAENPAVRDRLSGIGIEARSSTPEEFAAAIDAQRIKVASIAAAIGTKPAP
jgi:tripartite-type tricarboxylate transporter receptor subunit TctC